MELPISLFICGAICLATVYLMIQQMIPRWRPKGPSLEELDRRSERLLHELERLAGLEGKERLAGCRIVAKEMRWQSLFLVSIMNDWGYHHRQQKGETMELAIAAYRAAWELHWKVTRILFLMRFRPSLLKDCHRLRDAARQFGRMWNAFFRLCQAQYPNEIGDVKLPDL